MAQPAKAEERVERIRMPSPAIVKGAPEMASPLVTMRRTPRKPAMEPMTLAAESFSKRKKKTETAIEKKVPQALIIEVRTPEVWATPL